ncbi:MAG: protein kinase [Pyrinomonadaceae bacterium]
MYCPKCNENFEEGSRRFCPTDGTRLISEAAARSRAAGGIFANLIPKIGGLGDLTKESAADSRGPRLAAVESESESVPFFEFDDDEPDTVDFLKPVEPPAAVRIITEANVSDNRPMGRKVNAFEIPAGHVDIGEGYRQPAFTSDFRNEDPESFVGRVVKGRYKVTDFLGGDENGLAYLADDKLVEDRLVLVRILGDHETDEIMDSILAEERVSLSHFSHPNIARLIDSGQFTGGTHFIISEYVDALSVADILSIHGRFNLPRAARVIKQAAGALSEAHQQGIIHRDLRPQNLIIDATGDSEQLTLVNFGASSGDPTELNFAYKAPEVLDGRIATTASDTFSLAVVAYEMLTGQKPFGGATVKEMNRSQNIGFLSDGLPQGVDGVLKKALSINPALRYSKARDFGDAFSASLADAGTAAPIEAAAAPTSIAVAVLPVSRSEILLPLVPPLAEDNRPVVEMVASPSDATPASDEPAWKDRSPEPPQTSASRPMTIFAIGMLALLAAIAFGWYFFARDTLTPEQTRTVDQAAISNGVSNDFPNGDTEMPPQPRTIPQPRDTVFYQNSKQNLKADLLRNFVGFTMYYPKTWKVNGPQVGSAPNARGKFLDISSLDADQRLKEQMLVSYYPSKGTFTSDAERFPELVRETNETLKRILPGYEVVSEGEIKINGDWRGYEVKFRAGVDKLALYGRRIFLPAARPGVRNGFEITMLTTSLAPDIQGVDDVGVKGELGPILFSFEPSQNF